MIRAYWNVSIWTEKTEKAIKTHNQLNAIPTKVWGEIGVTIGKYFEPQ